MKVSSAIATLIVFVALYGPCSAADTGWTKLRVGQVAYVAAQLESDNDPKTTPVCGTNAEQIAFMRMEVNDCPHRKWGTVVVVRAGGCVVEKGTPFN